MMSWIFAGLIALSVIFGLVTGRIEHVSKAAINGSMDAVTMFLTLIATICLWGGLMKIAEESGLTKIISKLFKPITKRLFPNISGDHKAMQYITMNMTANLLGLGNAATPLGIAAMQELDKLNPNPSSASDNMVKFVVLNTASIQLIPSTIAALRLKNGSLTPFDIMPAIWAVSIISLTASLTMVYLLKGVGKNHGKV